MEADGNCRKCIYCHISRRGKKEEGKEKGTPASRDSKSGWFISSKPTKSGQQSGMPQSILQKMWRKQKTKSQQRYKGLELFPRVKHTKWWGKAQ